MLEQKKSITKKQNRNTEKTRLKNTPTVPQCRICHTDSDESHVSDDYNVISDHLLVSKNCMLSYRIDTPFSAVEQTVLKFYNQQLHLNIQPTDISIVHRLRKKNQQDPRLPNAIVGFTMRKVREMVYNARRRLQLYQIPANFKNFLAYIH